MPQRVEDVIITGGGPVGLMLASELALCGLRPVVLERLSAPTGLSKALGIQGAGVALLELRGLLSRFGKAAREAGGFPDFGGVPLPVQKLPDPKPRFLFVQQARVEAVLEDRALELGVDLRRGVEVLDFEADGREVRVHARSASSGQHLRARYLVGADGARSLVRQRSGIAFPGEPPAHVLRLGDVRLDGEVTVSGQETLIDGRPVPPGFGFPLGDGYVRVITREPLPPDFDRSEPLTLEALQASADRVFGGAPRLTSARWLSIFTDASRQAERYREGRVLLAGDAAHVHLPAGGPGLSTGLGDAVNLGWKLARVLRGEAPEALLDTYHAERHPAGARVLLHTRAQSALLSENANVAALKTLLGELFDEPHALRTITDLMQGVDIRYTPAFGDAPPGVGRFVSALTVPVGIESRPLSELIVLPRGLMLTADGHLADEARQLGLEVARVAHDGPSQLIRPDGFVAWEGTRATFGRALEHGLTI